MASWAHRLFQHKDIDPEDFFLMNRKKKVFLIASCLYQDELDEKAAEAQE